MELSKEQKRLVKALQSGEFVSWNGTRRTGKKNFSRSTVRSLINKGVIVYSGQFVDGIERPGLALAMHVDTKEKPKHFLVPKDVLFQGTSNNHRNMGVYVANKYSHETFAVTQAPQISGYTLNHLPTMMSMQLALQYAACEWGFTRAGYVDHSQINLRFYKYVCDVCQHTVDHSEHVIPEQANEWFNDFLEVVRKSKSGELPFSPLKN